MRYRLTVQRAVGWWFIVLVLAIINGAIREAVLVPSLGLTPGLILSGLMLCAFVVLVAAILVRREPRLSPSEAAIAGVIWLSFTLVLEFSLGAAQGKSASELLAPYRFEHGNLWPLVLLTVLVAPWAWSRAHHANT